MSLRQHRKDDLACDGVKPGAITLKSNIEERRQLQMLTLCITNTLGYNDTNCEQFDIQFAIVPRFEFGEGPSPRNSE